jgi:hypothetical protein
VIPHPSSFGPQPLILDNVAGDGNCLFRALAKQLAGGRRESSDAQHTDVRTCTFSYAMDNYDTVLIEYAELHRDEDLDFADYLQTLGASRNWAGHFEIGLAARALARPIWVFHRDGRHDVVEYEGVTHGQPLHIYHRGNHFQSVRRY